MSVTVGVRMAVRMPLRVSESDGLPYFIQLVARAQNPPAQAARLVVRNTCEMAV